MATALKRSKIMKLTVTPELHARLSALSDRMGIPPSTLASVAVGQYVAAQTSSHDATMRATDALVAHVGPEFAQLARQLKIGEADK